MKPSSFTSLGVVRPPSSTTFIPAMPPVMVVSSPTIPAAVAAPVVPAVRGTIEDVIMNYIEPTDRKECQGDPYFGLTIAKLLFSGKRDSSTAPYEKGHKMPIRRDMVTLFVDSVKCKANKFYGQSFATLPSQYEPEPFRP